MTSRLPSLAALRTFEAAARHESFKKAAEELSVTPVAVTRQVKALEQDLGLALFERHHRRVTVTPAGRALAQELGQAFAIVGRAVARSRLQAGRLTLRIGVDPVFGKRWLAPRLDAFRSRHPTIAVELVWADDSNARLDGVIYYGTNLKPTARRHVLFRDTVFPVCSPALVSGEPGLREPADLARHRLLHEGSVDWWQRWLDLAGLEDVETTSGAVFLASGEAYAAAVRGEGVMVGDDIVSAPELRDGTLMRPFAVTFEGGTYVLARRDPENDEAMDLFAAWLAQACRAHKEEMRRFLDLETRRADAEAPARA